MATERLSVRKIREILRQKCPLARGHRDVAASLQVSIGTVVGRVCHSVGLPRAHLVAGSRREAVTRARDGIAYLWVTLLGHSGRPLAPVLGVLPAAVYKAVQRGARQVATWERLLGPSRWETSEATDNSL